jgi:anion-transporting  ArsA/GET3 family ATPase
MFIFITGKGGTGKSLVSVILSNLLSNKGEAILYFPQNLPSSLYSLTSKKVTLYPLDYENEAKEYVKLKLKLFFLWVPLVRSQVFKVFQKVIPGFTELIYLGKMWYDWTKRKSDFYIFDAPPTGQILSMLNIPKAGLESGAAGPVRSDLQGMFDFVKKINIIIVSLPEQLPLEETQETVNKMRENGFFPKAIILNKFYRSQIPEEDKKWINSILVEGKLKTREKKELISLLRFDESLSANSQKFLSEYLKLGIPVYTINFSLNGITPEFVRSSEENLVQTSLFSHLS